MIAKMMGFERVTPLKDGHCWCYVNFLGCKSQISSESSLKTMSGEV